VQALGSIFEWIGANEAVLSGIAATIVILGVLYAPIRRLLRRSERSDPAAQAPAAPRSSAPALDTDSPSIAVMPFANLSGESDQEFLADGLTEDIILGLSRVKQLFVIARNTCFTYKGRTLDARVVSEELGVRYVLEGSVRRAGDRIRVTAQLVDAQTRTPTWAEHFDRKVEEILEVDDEVTEAIVAALQPALRSAEAEYARRAAPEDLTAWALVNQSWVAVQSDLGDVNAAQEAIVACQDALALDPDYAFAHAMLAHAKSLLVHQPEPADTADEALASIRRALELGADDPLVQHCHAALLGNLGRTSEAIVAWERAIELDPNNAGARAGLGIAKIFMRRADEALGQIDSALRRSPADPLYYHWLGHRALALVLTGHVSEAIDAARASLQRRPSRIAYAVLAGGLAHEGRPDEAGLAYQELAARYPGLVPEDFAHMAGQLAPEREWGQSIERAFVEAAAAAGRAAKPPAD
jgi:TolB-like protein/Tfp pilus assembly protein PilF